MNSPTLRQLRYLMALAEHQHFGRAADACAVTQPALSNQIKALEQAVGARLVERTSRQVHLTAMGEEVARRGRGIVAEVDELMDLASSARAGLGQVLRLGLIPTVAPYLLPDFAAALSTAYPGTELRPREAMTRVLIDDLISHRLDLAILALPAGHTGLEEVPLFEEEFMLVRHVSDSDQPVPTPRNLQKMKLLLLEEGHCLRDQALSVCDLGGRRPSDILEGSSLSTLVQMVGSGIGLTLIPEIAAPLETRIATVALERFEEDIPTRTIGMVWRKTSPFAERFADLRGLLAEAGQRVCASVRDSAPHSA